MTEQALVWVMMSLIVALFIPAMWLGDRLSDLIHAAKMWARSEKEEDFSEY